MTDKDKKFEVRGSTISGKGLFARSTIKTGDVVVVWHPRVISRKQADALPASEQHFLYPDGDRVLYMQEPERYMNHSCEPNTKVFGKSDVAVRDIEPGEEITSDYMDLETEDFVCQCGSNKCRSLKK